MDRAHAKDLQALRTSLESWIGIRQNITGIEFWGTDLGTAGQIVSLIQSAILDDPATTLTEGHLIKDGWSADLDHYRRVQNDFNSILEQYIAEERERTGISNLKVRYNRISGYYIEVSRGKISSVPEHFILKRSLVNGDRYTTERLRELEQELNSSGVRIIEEEKKLFLEVRDNIKQYISYLYQIAADIADFDAVSSFAQAAVEHGWVQPEVDDSDVLEIVNGRHPVVELHIPTGEFVPNNASFDDTKYFALITGPNMAGKSTYLRQNALIVLLAQTGSFVPAEKARIGIVDRIFCRVGASDNLARGESTFLVEMTETAHILRSATSQSLVIMDEVGRGTSTEDGLSIAWAVSEYLLNQIRCKTLFATHYHELTRLEHPALMQLCLEVLEQEGQEDRRVVDLTDRDIRLTYLGQQVPREYIDIIEKLIQNNYVERDGRHLVPTPKGRELVRLSPSVLASPVLTGEWEGRLEAISRGEEDSHAFISDIKKMARDLVENVRSSSLVYAPHFTDARECPYCHGQMMRVLDRDGSVHYICQRLSCSYEEKEVRIKVSTVAPEAKTRPVMTGDGKVRIVVRKGAVKKRFVQSMRSEQKSGPSDMSGGTFADFLRLSQERQQRDKDRRKGRK